MKKLFTLFTLSLTVTGCASIGGGDELLPRYVSPLHYSDYNCKQLDNTYFEFKQVTPLFAKYMNEKSNQTIRYQYKNEISQRDNSLSPLGLSILKGHKNAVKTALQNRNCTLIKIR